ncbi:hypothetical protein [Amaricoccus sp.]|uniref:hypothetical protein n=1 Tax=Amaricoccus sp. TaxID=1872485 RepID=UPI001B76AEE0|nr:hypothetical protein [Amaricoccus sp.]MBP7240778.1 hypothetical protein [Amaricoccus sp.]
MTESDDTARRAAEADPRGLIREAYRMAIGPAECRSILLDWALGQPTAGPAEIARLLDLYAGEAPDHPMTTVLREGLATPAAPRRRGRRAHGAAGDGSAKE